MFFFFYFPLTFPPSFQNKLVGMFLRLLTFLPQFYSEKSRTHKTIARKYNDHLSVLTHLCSPLNGGPHLLFLSLSQLLLWLVGM